MQRKLTASIIATLFLGVAACVQKAEVPKSESPFKPTATLQELMVSIIDPNVDPIWNSVSTVSTKEGTVEKQPQSDEEWKTLRNHAITLSEVSNLLVIEGRKVTVDNASTSAHPVELSPKEVQKGVEANHPAFVQHAHALHNAVEQAIAAINAKNPQDLVKAGGEIDRACERCHSQFWYPNDKRPTASLELGLQSGSSLYMKMRKLS